MRPSALRLPRAAPAFALAVIKNVLLAAGIALLTLDLSAANTPPIANAGGPYQLTTDGTVVLNASASADLDVGDAPTTFDWDINGDGTFGDATGATPTLLWSAQRLPVGTSTLSVRVTDSRGASRVATAQLTVVSSATQSPPGHLATFAAFGGRSNGAQYVLAPPVVASDGKIYGTTDNHSGLTGAIYRMNTDGSGFVVVHSTTPATDGTGMSGLVQADDGKLYGTASGGGRNTFGTIFSVTPDGVFTVLHDPLLAQGSGPVGGLVKGADGRLYGIFASGGPTDGGRVYAFDPRSGQITYLHDFVPATDGANPSGGLVIGTDGKLYGTTASFPAGHGTIYRLNTDGTGFTILRTLVDSNDGYGASGPMVQGDDGKLYGAFRYGGGNFPGGLIFSISPSGAYTILHAFGGAGDGVMPTGGLVRAANGKMYGTTEGGGALGGPANRGIIFSITTGGAYTIERSLVGATDGAQPDAGLGLGPDGKLIGATFEGAGYGWGALFSYSIDGTFTVLHPMNYPPNGTQPLEGVIQAGDGRLYGTTSLGGPYGWGTIYRINLDGSGHTVLHAFDGTNDGGTPMARLLLASDGRLYGSTRYSGPNLNGTFFRLNLDGTGFTVLRSPTATSDGGGPSGALMQASNGVLYGTTSMEFATGGALFRMNPDGTGFTVVRSLIGGQAAMLPGLVEAANHRLYGASETTLYSIPLDATSFATEVTLNYSVIGKYVRGSLVQGDDGLLYGVTGQGGAKGCGTVFAFDPATRAINVVHTIDPTEGYEAVAGLTKAADGKFYGTTSQGGPLGGGVLFSVTPAGAFTVVRLFNAAAEGIRPRGTLVQATNGKLYGTTSDGGLYPRGFTGAIYVYGPNQPPTAAFSIATNAAATGVPVQFNAAASGDPDADPLTYAWDFGDGSTGTGVAPTHVYASSGDFTVRLQVNDLAGATTSTSTALAVATAAPAAQIYFGTIGAGGQFALYLRNSREAVLMGRLAGNGGSFMTTTAVAVDGTFTATVTSGDAGTVASASLELASHPSAAVLINGRIDGPTITGAVATTGEALTGSAQLAAGTTSSLAGFYEASVTYSVDSRIAFIVGTNGVAMAASITGIATQAALGNVGGDGTVSVAFGSGTTLQGAFNASTRAVSGQFIETGGAGANFGGVSDTVAHTDRLINISTRGLVGDAEKAMFAGFVITGSQPKTVLVRASGPALAGYGVAGAMDNPVLKIIHGTTEVSSNDNWDSLENSTLLASAADRVGAFPLAAGSKDAALVATLPPGVYSAQVTRAPGTSFGLTLVEVYDASPNPATEEQRIVNISTRGEVQTAERKMIAGFVVTGNVAKKVLVRAVGPTLGAYGVADVLVNPRVDLFLGQEVIASNDDWGNASALAAVAAQVGAFALAPGSKDAALLITLAPGVYSAQVSGVAGGTGIVLLEVYEVP